MLKSVFVREKGRTFNSKNEKLLRQAKAALDQALAALDDESKDTEETDAKEAADFNQSDARMILQQALRKQFATLEGDGRYPWLVDVYDTYCIFQVGYSDGAGFSRVDYTLDEAGAVSFGIPTPVVRKVTYVAASDVTEAQQTIEIDAETVQLVEAAVSKDGLTTLKLIAPGWGSSGYYPAEVLKRDGPKVFKTGTHNYINHPTVAEEQARPEGDVDNLGSVLIEDAKWYDTFTDKRGKDHGPGLYAQARVKPAFAETLNTFGTEIGTSIRASGKARVGEADGKKGPIIETITTAKSVDYVTLPGAGGKVVSLFESARQSPLSTEGSQPMSDEKELQALKESIVTLQRQLQMNDAANAVHRVLSAPEYQTIPAHTRNRVQEIVLSKALPLTESQTLDHTKLIEATKDVLQAELAYLVRASGTTFGAVQGLGVRGSDEVSLEETLKAIDAELLEMTKL